LSDFAAQGEDKMIGGQNDYWDLEQEQTEVAEETELELFYRRFSQMGLSAVRNFFINKLTRLSHFNFLR
jgi:hypothetical protein